MDLPKKPSASDLLKTIDACLENGTRLLEETYDLEFRKPTSSRFFFAMIAQEEFAKAFIFFLVKEGVVPLSPPVFRAINDHVCKQLVGMIMDYMIMHWEDIDELERAITADANLGDRLPNDVGSAIEILRYEKIGRWEASNWVWAENPDYDGSALNVAEGKKDRRKQDALYVRVGRNGRVTSTPAVIAEWETREELERANRYRGLVQSALDGDNLTYRFEKTVAVLRMLFANLAVEP